MAAGKGAVDMQSDKSRLGASLQDAVRRGRDDDQLAGLDKKSPLLALSPRHVGGSVITERRASRTASTLVRTQDHALSSKRPEPPARITSDYTGRPYHRMIGRWGRVNRLQWQWLRLPGNYPRYPVAMVGLPGLPWVCPIRSCRYAFREPSTLDKHWRVSRSVQVTLNYTATDLHLVEITPLVSAKR